MHPHLQILFLFLIPSLFEVLEDFPYFYFRMSLVVPLQEHFFFFLIRIYKVYVPGVLSVHKYCQLILLTL